jgi:hypothetical protein
MMSAPNLAPVCAKHTSKYTTVIVGHGSSAVTIQTLVAPSITALMPDKAMSFDFLFQQLQAFHTTLHVLNLTPHCLTTST